MYFYSEKYTIDEENLVECLGSDQKLPQGGFLFKTVMEPECFAAKYKMNCPKCTTPNLEGATHCTMCYEVLNREKYSARTENVPAADTVTEEHGVLLNFAFRISTMFIHTAVGIAQTVIYFNVPFETLKATISATLQKPATLLLYSFGHVSDDHYYKNLISFVIFGTAAALALSPVEYALLYMFAAVTGGFWYAITHMHSNGILLGSSGVTRGYMGFAVIMCLLYRFRFPYARYFKLFIYSFAAMLIVKDIFSYYRTDEPTAYAVHFVSMVAGMVFGALLFKGKRIAWAKGKIKQ